MRVHEIHQVSEHQDRFGSLPVLFAKSDGILVLGTVGGMHPVPGLIECCCQRLLLEVFAFDPPGGSPVNVWRFSHSFTTLR